MRKDRTPKQSVDLLDTLEAHTVHLIECDATQRMCGRVGSGFLWDRGEKLHLLTVAHIFRGAENAIRLDAELHSNGIAMLVEVPEPGWVRTTAISSESPIKSVEDILTQSRDVDFAWATYDSAKLTAKLQAGAKLKGISCALRVIRHDLNIGMSTETKYNFAARVPTNYHRAPTRYNPLGGDFDWKQIRELDMSFDGVETGGEYDGMYRFQLAQSHRGDAHYHGCSGAPIADDQGNPVALVARGDEKANIIFGCPLQPFVRLIELPD